MVVPLELFVQQLENSGILAGETIKDFIPPKASPKDADELVKELIRQKKLTKFQAEEVYRGKGKSLVLGNYILMEMIGEGGMGQVFKARHSRMDRLVAVKLLPQATTKDKAVIARFEREVKAAAKLSHPNIVSAHDADCANSVHFLVMELVEGSDLSALVKKNGPFSIQKAVNCVLQAARGLEFAHKKGVVHRDIKPANLLVDTEGTVKVLDMGMARLAGIDNDSPQAELTSTGTIMGTVDYMAPEQALDTKTADARADIYSLGCSLYFLLTGKATYSGDTIMKKLLAHREKPIPSILDSRPDVPQQLDAVFQKMVAKKLQDRYQSMSEVIADLELLESGKQETITVQQSDSTKLRNSEATFIQSLPVSPTPRQSKMKRLVTGGKGKGDMPPWKNLKVLMGAALLGGILLAGIIISLQTKDGKLIVEVDQTDAMVQVLDLEGKVEISQKGGSGPIVISVDPGKHRLKVEKDGFTTYGQEFEMEKGGKKEITAKLVPLEEMPEMVNANPEPVVAEKKLLFFETPAFASWTNGISIMSAEQQVEAVSKKLVELNPGFDGKLTDFGGQGSPKIDNGNIKELSFFTDSVTDISPVRALKGLSRLHCLGSSSGKGRLSDLSPLEGLPLTLLSIGWTQVADLSPLLGMPLTELSFYGTQVDELSMLRGMKLTRLMCNVTKVFDLSPLQGMPLTSLYCDGTQISDLSPLRGMPLTTLFINNSEVSDLSPLKSMPLKELIVSNCHQLSDLSPLKDMKLSTLQFDNTHVSDPSSLRDLPLTSLGFANVFVSDNSFMKGMPLKTLRLSFSLKRDTELLRSMKTLETINDQPVAEFWKKVDERLTWIKPVTTYNDPDFKQWQMDVANLSAEEQIEAVSKKLVELNPGFDGKLMGPNGQDTPNIVNGKVYQLSFITDSVADISPVRALMGLKLLWCIGSEQGKGKLYDLSPLKGLPLTKLILSSNEVSDLSPIQGMPLTLLSFQNNDVSDLIPIQGMKLTELQCTGNKALFDLSPLEDMPLKALQIENTSVENLSPLKGIMLTTLNVDSTMVTDLSPLQNMKLGELRTYKTLVSDLTPLQGMPLTILDISQTRVSDLSPIKDLPLKKLHLAFKPERDTELLRSIKSLETINNKPVAKFWNEVGERKPLFYDTPEFAPWSKEVAALPAEQQVEAVSKKLVELNPGFSGKLEGIASKGFPIIENGEVTAMSFDCTIVTDISPVRSLVGLKALYCGGSGETCGIMSDLSPLKGLKLTYLSCGASRVSDLSPLIGMELTNLYCSKSQISDLSPLTGMPLILLSIHTSPVSDLSPLKGMKLRFLYCNNSQVSDLSPLQGMPLTHLYTRESNVTDYSPLRDMSLSGITLDFKPERDTELLRSIKTLEKINEKPVAEFWKEVERKN